MREAQDLKALVDSMEVRRGGADGGVRRTGVT